MNIGVTEAQVLAGLVGVLAVIAFWRLEQVPLIDTNPKVVEPQGRPQFGPRR
jgi:hypothetical protein